MGRRQLERIAVPEFFFEAALRHGEDVTRGEVASTFVRALAQSVAETLGAELDALEDAGVVGEVVFLGGDEFRFVPAARFREPQDGTVSDVGNGEPDDSPAAIAGRLLDGLEADVGAIDTCNGIRDLLVDRAEIFVDVQPNPFDAQETDVLDDAILEVARNARETGNRLNCKSISRGLHLVPAFLRLRDAVESSRPATRSTAEAFIDEWGETEFSPTFTFRDVAERVSNITEPSGTMSRQRCLSALETIEEAARATIPILTARELLNTQQRGRDVDVKNAFDDKTQRAIEAMREDACLSLNEPDFAPEDLRDLVREVSLDLIRPSQDLREDVNNLVTLTRRIRTPATERVGAMRAVPGTEEEELRREGEVAGTRIGAEGLLDTDLRVEFEDVDVAQTTAEVVEKRDGGVAFAGLRPDLGPPLGDRLEEIREAVRRTVFLEDVDDGVRFARVVFNEDRTAVARFTLLPGAPVRSPDPGDLVIEIRDALGG